VLGQAASDVFTAADVRIQKTIEFNLKQLYPRAKIIGKHGFCVIEYQGRRMTLISRMISKSLTSCLNRLIRITYHRRCFLKITNFIRALTETICES
jgi:hypothetical protein